METSAAGSVLTDQKYYPFGAQRDTGPVATAHRFTGQKKDESGLYYYNARYYDPEIGHFISPDTLVPDPLRVDAYNRYMYAYGNPLKYRDPSGHETGKPGWWPPYVPYFFDLPDEWSYDGFVEWSGENNVPTATSGQVGGGLTGGLGLHGNFSGALHVTFDWLSGEYLVSWNNSAGMRGGTPQNGGNGSIGVSAHYNASTVDSLTDASMSVTADGGLDALGKVGLQATAARAVQYDDRNGNGRFDILDGEGAYFKPSIDPVFDDTVDSLSLDLSAGFNITPLVPFDAGLTGALNDTNEIIRVNVYQPIRWIRGKIK